MTQNMVESMTEKIMKNTNKHNLSFCLFIVLVWLLGLSIVATAEKLPENILINGDFDNQLDKWSHWTHDNANALFMTEGRKAEPIIGKNAAFVNINDAGDALWHIQFYQQPFTLEKDKTYTYNLWAKSEKPRSITMRILHQGDPWNEYAKESINLTDTWKEYFITFKMQADDVNTRAGLIMGGQKVDVWFDHIRLYEGEHVQDIEGAEPHSVDPDSKIATTWATLKNLY